MNEHTRGNGIGAYHSCIILLLLLMALTPSAAAADMMFRANPEHTGVYDNGGIVPTNSNLWRFATGDDNIRRDYVDGSPVIVNGVVYVGSTDRNLYAIDTATGKEKWRFPHGNGGSPAVSNGVVYVGSTDPNLYAIDAVTGKEKWHFATGNSGTSSPTVANGIVYFGSADKNLYAIDAVTGKEKWKLATQEGASSPAVANGSVYFGSADKNLYAIDAENGIEIWHFLTGHSASSSPAVANGVVYLGSADNNVYAIDAVTGKEKWRFVTEDGVLSSPSVANDIVYVGSNDGNLYAIDAVTGKEKWRFTTKYWVLSSPSVANDIVYVGSKDGNLYAIDTTTGKEIWHFATRDPVISSPAVANGVVYFGSRDGYLYALDAKTGKSGDSIFSLPVIIILAIVLFFGVGVGIYRLRGKPRSDQPPDRKKEKAITRQPTPIISSNDAGDTASAVTSAKPALTLSLDNTRLVADKWHKVEMKITNVGNALASDIHLTFSDDFETRWVTAVSVKSKESVALSIGIKPKTEGNIPIEITASYKDGRNKDYRQVFKFWIDVAGKMGVDSGGTPSPSPVSQFTPRPLTPKQLPPELSDRYTESEFIGKGGFARVFKAKRKDGKYVAVKIPISLDASTGRSFIAEMQNWTKLDHPNIVRVFDYNIMPSPYFEMELCDSSLAEREKPIESEEAAWILFNVCEGLKFTHAQKIIHRDLKPQNILLKNGVPKISDWGLSRVITESTSTTAASFTPYYAAPEQISSEHKDERTDIWQLGVIFYELVTGQLPFTGDSMVAIMAAIATKNPTLPSAITPSSHDVEAMIMKCLEKDPNKRYQSVLELQKDLALYLRITYTESLKKSVTVKDYTRSAYYCGDLVMVNLLTGDMKSAYKFLLDFVHYSKGDVKIEAQELSEQIKMRMEMGVTEIPDELITKAEIIVHQVRIGSEKWDKNENGLDALFE